MGENHTCSNSLKGSGIARPAQFSNCLRAYRAAITLSLPPTAPETLLAASRSSMEIWFARPAPTAVFTVVPSAVFLLAGFLLAGFFRDLAADFFAGEFFAVWSAVMVCFG